MGKKSDPPPPPDYTGAAVAQGQASQQNLAQQTWANRPDILTPFGSQTWDVRSVRDPATGQNVTNWAQSTNLHPQMQRALDAQMENQVARSRLAGSFQDRVRSDFSQPFSMEGAPELQSGIQSGEMVSAIDPAADYSQRAEDAFYDRAASRLDARFGQQEADMHALLVNQGFKPGDEGYDRAMANLGRERTDAYGAAAQDAILKGGQEAARLQGMDVTSGQFANAAQNQMFNQDLSAAQLDNQVRQQWIADQMLNRNVSLNEMNALLTGQQVGMPNIPTFQPAGVAETPQLLSAMNMGYQGQLDAYNAQQARGGALMGGLFDLGAGYLSGGGTFGF